MRNLCWPLHGQGIEALGRDGKPEIRDIADPADDQILVRHTAVGLCYSDVKEVLFGSTHPRLTYRDLGNNPVVPGHEVCMTVVKVGKDYKDTFKVGERYSIQPDVWYGGKSMPFSFNLDGAYEQYSLLGKEVLKGDGGCYLIPVPDSMSNSDAALTEPWACVEASYRATYRTAPKEGGSVLIYAGEKQRAGYCFEAFLSKSPISKVVICTLNQPLASDIESYCKNKGIQFMSCSIDDLEQNQMSFDDIFCLDGTSEEIQMLLNLLGVQGILAIMSASPISDIKFDIGRVHYDSITIVGSNSTSFEKAYLPEIRIDLKDNGIAMIQGAGGPIGMMHLQRAIEANNRPRILIATNRNPVRLRAISETFGALAKSKGVELICLNPVLAPVEYKTEMSRIVGLGGVDDIQVMITDSASIVESFSYLAPGGTLSMFAGIKKGTFVTINPTRFFNEDRVRFVGHSGSVLEDQLSIFQRFTSGQLELRRSVAAIGGMDQFANGVKAMKESRFPGKIIIYPTVEEFPLVALSELESLAPDVFCLLEDGRIWTREAEEQLIKQYGNVELLE